MPMKRYLFAFLTLLFLFIRFLPMISIAEMRELVHRTGADRRAEQHAAGEPKPQAPSD